MKNKLFIASLTICALFASCAKDYKYTDINGNKDVAKPYGWANYQENHSDSIEYNVNVPNVVFSVLFCETVVVPIWLTGWELFEPIGIEGEVEHKEFLP